LKVSETTLPGVLVVEPTVFRDARGLFLETFNRPRYAAAGMDIDLVQHNLSSSVRGTLRGLHYQEPRAQGKLVQVLRGSVYDVAVDIRRGSPSFGKWFAITLDGEERCQLWIPPGFAHGFCVVSDSADFFYCCSETYAPENDRAIAWNDPQLAIPWPIESPLLSAKDAKAPTLADALVLPGY
jgi:dTDP-4-dehydrorhamnose 3,5-epimerase